MPDPVHPAVAARIIADFRDLKARMVRAAQHLKDAMAMKPVSDAHAEALPTLVEHKQGDLASLQVHLDEGQAAVAALPPQVATAPTPLPPTLKPTA